MADLYAKALPSYIAKGIQFELLNPILATFDLEKLGKAINHERDQQFTDLGLQTLYDRYFIHKDGIRFELPQIFFMRVAMGLASNEENREERAIEFYNLISSFDYMTSTPQLFNSGTLRPQLSSCFLTTVPDDLEGIFKSVKDNALLAKYSGGLGNDWSRVRGLGARPPRFDLGLDPVADRPLHRLRRDPVLGVVLHLHLPPPRRLVHRLLHRRFELLAIA
jgi:ribonucleoside-diphosphate reductase alpha chain